MKKRILFSLVLVLTVILAACSNGDSDDDNSYSEKHAPTNVKKITEQDIFSSDKKGEQLSEDEANQAIKKYLDVNSDILDNKYLIQYKLDKQTGTDTKITDKQAKRLSELSHNAVKNDVRFEKFVKNNTLPKGYKENVDRIITYFKALNSTISNADEDIEQLDYQPQNELNVVDVSTKYAGDVNGKQQDKIKKFLKEKEIKTDAVDK
ncbi:NDxxF motif lipoprotein [Staphylococcus caeli]|uniref:Lipoprotein n=1 Tax=Staphylococcus caeli TaxID=2201815 RepID=A0A1D4MTI7_9STAP|nr:NDxxF motif lipoprotein [Staphylococcus caeli]SCT01728.1 putative lipoprotein [Staphylococcus caeli]SCT23761.1 putative lipoprotein [Staphylococcus caeli]